MKAMRPLVSFLAAGVFAISAHAQVLGKISASPNTAKVGEAVTVTANIDVVVGNYCGFVVGFGDGSVQDGVSDKSNPSPLALQHTYAKAGAYHITLGGRNVQNHPNCGGEEKAVDVTITDSSAKPVTGAAATSICPAGWKLVGKSKNAKTGAFACSAKPGTFLPEQKPVCSGDLTYYENSKKGQLGCRP